VHFADKITEKTKETGSPLCLGLDPHQDLIPDLFKKKLSQLHLADIEDFLFEVINLAKGKVAALKPQVAFFEEWGPEGLSLLAKISKFAKDLDIPIIMDAKRSDIGSTSVAYANAWLGDNSHFYADALTVNPWMGIDTIRPFIEVAKKKNKGVFILLKTSNPGSKDIQSLEVNGESIFLKISKLIKENLPLNLGKSGYSNIGVVVGATKPKEAELIRQILPTHLFLIPGYGAQGGSAKDAFSGLILRKNIYEGGLINSSRAILFPEKSKKYNSIYKWRESVIMALNKAKNDLIIN
jgi:orotidine-5'-phosphate decarboxylase